MKRGRGGVSYVLALIVVMLLGALGMAMMHGTGQEIRKGRNQRDGMNARLAAESGMTYLTEVLEDFAISGSPGSSTVLNSLGSFFSDQLTAGSVSSGTENVTISELQAGPSGSSCTAEFTPGSETNQFRLSVTGLSEKARRTVEMRFDLVPGGAGIFEKGIVSAGPIHVSGSALIEGANDPAEATVLSLTGDGIVFDLTSSCDLAGDIYTVSENPESIDLSGAVTVAGISRNDPAIWDHIHLGTERQELPRPDTSIFTPFATNTLTEAPQSGETFTNLRIPAGTNPTFNDNTVIKGVLYIESPNIVTFGGSVFVSGVIVTDDAGTTSTSQNQLVFSGNASIEGVESLPEEPEFDELRSLPGSSILAPGFKVTMTGSMGTVGGTLAAEKFVMQGNATAVVKGLIVNLGDDPFDMSGSTHVVIDRSESEEIPPGFTVPLVLTAVRDTYTEP